VDVRTKEQNFSYNIACKGGRNMEGKVLEVNNLTKTYGSKGFQTKVLKGISLSICERDFIAIMGPSGSGDYVKIRLS